MERQETFIFRLRWRDAIAALPDDVRLEIYEGILDYVSGIDSQLSPLAQGAFLMAKYDIDKTAANYAELCKTRQENGKKGGNPDFKKGQPNPYYHKEIDNQEITKDNQMDMIGYDKITKDNQMDMIGYDKITKDNQMDMIDNQTYPKISPNNNINNNINNIDIDNNIDIYTKDNIIDITIDKKKEENNKKKKEEFIIINPAFAEFQEWLKTHTPRVAKMAKPFTEAQWQEMIVKYDAKIAKDVLYAMDNYKTLNNKYISAYGTFRQWAKKEMERYPQSSQQSKQPVSKIDSIAELVNTTKAVLTGQVEQTKEQDEQNKRILSMFN